MKNYLFLFFLFISCFSEQSSANESNTGIDSKILFSAENEEDIALIKTRDSVVTLEESNGQKMLKIIFNVSDKFPDVKFPAPQKIWDLTSFSGIRAEVTNLGLNSAKIVIRVDNPGSMEERKWIFRGSKLAPGETKWIEVQFQRGAGKGESQYNLDPSQVSACHIYSESHNDEITISVKSIQAFGGSGSEKKSVPGEAGVSKTPTDAKQ